MHPVLFTIPGLDLPVHTYGVMIVSGFLLAVYISWLHAQRQQKFLDETLDFGFWALVGGMIGARVVFIAVNWETYFRDRVFDTVEIPYFVSLFKAPDAGIASLVGLIGLAAGYVYTVKRKQGWGSRIFNALFGFLAGRAAYYFFHSEYSPGTRVNEEWLNILVVWRGGLVFYGAALGGVAAFALFCWRRKLSLTDSFHFADIIILGLPLAHVFGRFGCVAAGCCWGDASFHWDGVDAIADIPFAAQFPSDALAYQSLIQNADPQTLSYMQEHSHTVPLIPIQLMESFGESLVFLSLLYIRARKWFHGQVVLTYFILYPVLRSILETMRGDTERGYVIEGVLSTSQFISLLVAASSFALILYLRKKRAMQVADTFEREASASSE